MTRKELVKLLYSWGYECGINADEARFVRQNRVVPAELINDGDIQSLATIVVDIYISQYRFADALEMLRFIPLVKTDDSMANRLRTHIPWKDFAEKIPLLENLREFRSMVAVLPLSEPDKMVLIRYAVLSTYSGMDAVSQAARQLEQEFAEDLKHAKGDNTLVEKILVFHRDERPLTTA